MEDVELQELLDYIEETELLDEIIEAACDPIGTTLDWLWDLDI